MSVSDWQGCQKRNTIIQYLTSLISGAGNIQKSQFENISQFNVFFVETKLKRVNGYDQPYFDETDPMYALALGSSASMKFFTVVEELRKELVAVTFLSPVDDEAIHHFENFKTRLYIRSMLALIDRFIYQISQLSQEVDGWEDRLTKKEKSFFKGRQNGMANRIKHNLNVFIRLFDLDAEFSSGGTEWLELSVLINQRNHMVHPEKFDELYIDPNEFPAIKRSWDWMCAVLAQVSREYGAKYGK